MTIAIYKKLLLLAAFTMLMLASCSKDEIAGNPGNNPGDGIRFEIGFAPQGSPATRVATDTQFNSTWEEGDQIGVFAVEHGKMLASSGNFFHNVKLTYRSGMWVAAETMDWPADGTKLDFYAYYPYDAEVTDPTAITFNVASDQNASTGGKPNYNRSNLLMAKADNLNEGFARGNTVTLDFKHALAMVQMKTGANIVGVNVVRLNGCVTETTLDLYTQTTAAASSARPQQVTMYACPNDGGASGTFAYRALVPVQTIAAGTAMFRIESDASGLYQSPKLTGGISLMAGKAEYFDFSTPYMSVTISYGNSLSKQLEDFDLTTITHLKVFGEMSSNDFRAIADIPSLTMLDLSDATSSNKTMPTGTFRNKKSLKTFFFPQNIISIAREAFDGCSNLEELTIPGSVTSIKTSAFNGCGKLGGLKIPGSVKTIGDRAFSGCISMDYLNLEEGVDTIGNYAFKGCGIGGSLIIPNSVKTIGQEAFKSCNGGTATDGLEEIYIPSGVREIGSSAFANCKELTYIYCGIPDLSKVTFGDGVFDAVPTEIIVIVPEYAKNAYKEHPVWRNFKNINPSTPVTP